MAYITNQPQGSPEGPKGPRVVQNPASRPAHTNVLAVGRWWGIHPSWQNHVDILGNGTFTTTAGNAGTWGFDGRTLRLVWTTGDVAELEVDIDGVFRVRLPKGVFSLRRL